MLISTLILSGCAAPRSAVIDPVELPTAWQSSRMDGSAEVLEQTAPATPAAADGWVASFAAPYLSDLVQQALVSNYELAQQSLQVEIARQQVTLLRADRLPSLSLALSGQRFRASGDNTVIRERVDVSANLDFELDLWGKLSDAQTEALLRLQAAEMSYLDAQRRLAADVVVSAFNAIASNQLQALFNQRLQNLGQGLDVIERGYRSGLNEALDVYLARNTVEQERANVANQQQVSFQATTRLEILLAEYPAARLAVRQTLPPMTPAPAVGLPSELLTRRPDIQLAWLELLAADAALAVAHKNRFPSLNLSGSLNDSDSALHRLLDGGDLGFVAAASLFQPLFLGGRLKALEQQALLRTEQAERRYLQVVYATFAEVENELNRAVSLADRYDAFVAAQSNAEAALTLAFAQYRRGLVSFTTVLEAQRRAFDAQTTVINLRNQQLQNRVALLLALGGNY
jgi:NodT family efflux transporter outer membrane factor (OMF) lipoprotein